MGTGHLVLFPAGAMLADPSATSVFADAPRLAAEVAYGLALLAVYAGWSRAYPR